MKRLLVLLLVAACSGGGDSSAKKDFLDRAERICAQANDDQDALKAPTTPKELGPYVARIVAIADTATTELEKLTLPPDDAADLRSKVLEPLSAQLEVGHAYADEVLAASAKNDTTALAKLLGSAPTTSRADLAWMRSYGFDACVDAADTSS